MSWLLVLSNFYTYFAILGNLRGLNAVLSGYVGCFEDSATRILNGFKIVRKTSMTNDLCIGECFSRKFPYSGTEYAWECFCGDGKYLTSDRLRDDTECQVKRCPGNQSQYCGGNWRIAIYSIDLDNSTNILPENKQKNFTGNGTCLCNCASLQNSTTLNSSMIQNTIEKRKKLLEVNQKMTTKFLRTKTCAKDERTSSKSIGMVGSFILALYFVILLSFDVLNIVMYFYNSQ